MTDYLSFSVEEFFEDSYFQSWVINPTLEVDTFWKQFLENYPEKQEAISQARAQILAFEALFGDSLSTEEIDEEIELLKIKASIHPVTRERVFPLFYKVAAACLLTLGGAAYYFLSTPTIYSNSVISPKTTNEAEWISVENQLDIPKTILLNDGSEVILGQNSSLTYLSDYSHESIREVHLSGEAFFEVAKDSLHPFLVYAGTTVTRVIGTSFRVESADDLVEVRVATGKVAVHRLQDFVEHVNNHTQHIPGVVLSPNVKAVFKVSDETFNTSRMRSEEEIVLPRTDFETDYIDESVIKILDDLSQTYQIEIQYDKAVLQHCHINTMFRDETLIQKIKLICMAIDAEFRIINGGIQIGAAHCH